MDKTDTSEQAIKNERMRKPARSSSIRVVYNDLTMLVSLMRMWRKMPMWMHLIAAWLARPKFLIGVSAVIFDDYGRILLFRHTYRIFEWGLPAGGLEYGEDPERAIEREFYEEAGMTLQTMRLLKVEASKDFKRHIGLVYLCKIMDGVFRTSHEIAEMKYFEINDLPRMLFAEKDLIQWVANTLKEDGFE